MQPYLNEDQLVFLVNLSQCSFYDAWDLTNPSSRTLIEECPEFVSDAYLKFKFDIQDIEYFEISEQDIDEKHWNQAHKDNEKYAKVYNSIVKNWESKKSLFSGLKLSAIDLECLDSRLQITAVRTASSTKEITKFLDDYLKLYEEGSLYREEQNTVQPSYHLNKFVKAINYFSKRYGRNRVKINIKQVFEGKKELFDFDDKPSDLPHDFEYRFTEFFLLMEKKGYIEVLELTTSHNYTFRYEYVINILRDPKEILSLEENWYSYGTLSLQPESGHIFNGNIKPKLTISSAPFKLLEKLIKAPEQKFSLEELETDIFSGVDQSVSKEQSKTRIQDAAKRAKESLKMNAVDSSVNVFSKDGFYWLGTVPSRQ